MLDSVSLVKLVNVDKTVDKSDEQKLLDEAACLASSCPLVYALNVFGGKWKLQIIWTLAEKPMRFGELKRALQSISEKILIQQLKQMEEHELINRKMFAQVPPKVVYSLTEKSIALLPVLKDLHQWSKKHIMPIKNKVKKGKPKQVAVPLV